MNGRYTTERNIQMVIPLVTALPNLCMNLIMVQFWGIYGVLLSTVLSMLFVGMPWLLHNLFTVLFDKSQMWGYIRTLVKYVLVAGGSCIACDAVSSLVQLSAVGNLFYRAIICCIVPNVLYFFVYRKTTEFAQCVHLVDKMTRYKLSHLV